MAAREANPQVQVDELARRLDGARELPRATLLRGQEGFFREAASRALLDAAARLRYEVCRHDASDREFSASALLADVASNALFAGARLVVLHEPEPLFKKSGGSPLLAKALLAALARKGSDALVLVAESMRADHALAKAVAAADGLSVHCRKLWDAPPPWDPSQDPRKTELAQWLLGRARARKIDLDANQALMLIAASGNDLFALDAQLDRVREGRGKAMFELIKSDAAGSPFKLADDLARGDAPAALFGLETLFQNGMREDDGTRKLDSRALIAMLFAPLRRSLRQALAAGLALEAGATPAEAEASAGADSDFARRSLQRLLAARPAQATRAMLADLAALERGQRQGASLDHNDLALFALRWRARDVATAARRAR